MTDSLSTGVSTGDMNTRLELFLDKKQKGLQKVGILGQRILSRHAELEERVRQLRDLEAQPGNNDQDLDSEIREWYRELTEMVEAWDAQLTQSLGPKVCPLCPFFALREN